MFLPDHLDRDEIMAEATFELSPFEAASLSAISMEKKEISSKQAEELLAAATAQAQAKAAAFLAHQPSQTSSLSPLPPSPVQPSSGSSRRNDRIGDEDTQAQAKAAAFLAHTSSKRPSLSPLPPAAESPQRSRQTSGKEDGEVTPASATFATIAHGQDRQSSSMTLFDRIGRKS